MTIYYHGSTSASLIGVFDKNKPGLKPMSQILADGQVPYSGECFMCLDETNLSHKVICAQPADFPRGVVEYTRSSNCSTTREDYIAHTINELESMRVRKTEYPFLEHLNQRRVELFEKRLERFPKLSPEEQDFVINEFPIIYSFEYHGDKITMKSDFHEDGIPFTFFPSELRAFVADKRIPRVRTYALRNGHTCQIEPMSRFLAEVNNRFIYSPQDLLK